MPLDSKCSFQNQTLIVLDIEFASILSISDYHQDFTKSPTLLKMKPTSVIACIALQVVAVLSSPVDPTEAGPDALGVSPANLYDTLTKRECWYGKPFGCSKGYCYKTCGDAGSWCWMADTQTKQWVGCGDDDRCRKEFLRGRADCNLGPCKDCGCSC